MSIATTAVRWTLLNPKASLPQYMSVGASGCDVQAVLEEVVILAPGQRAAVPTGIAVEIPEGYEIQVRPRSGLALKKGVTVLNTPGTIDSDYRGEIKVILINLGNEPVPVSHGERIAQFVLRRVERIEWVAAEALGDTARGAGGFGSTGLENPV